MTTTEPPGPALTCPGCGSPDVNLGCGLLCGTCAETAAGIRGGAEVLAQVALPPPVADYGPVRLELMGHRYREGRLSEVVIAGQPFLRLDLAGGHVEYYRPDAVYCITPGVSPHVPLAAIPERFSDALDDSYDDDDEEGLF